MQDDRVFRLTTWGTKEYCNKRGASARCARSHNPVTKVEATDAEATTGWTDVTSEFPRVVARNADFQARRSQFLSEYVYIG